MKVYRNKFLMFRFLTLILIIIQPLLAKVSVLPTQGEAGDSFHFKVALTNKEYKECSTLYIRIYNDKDYYDYTMNDNLNGEYTLTLTIDEESPKKEFIIGIQDHHGQIQWKEKKHFFRVFENNPDFQTAKVLSQSQDITEVYVNEVMQNVLNCLNKKRGYTVWNGVKKHGCWVRRHNTYCARFVRMCFGEERKYGTAIQMYKHYQKEGLIQTTGTPPEGAVVFYQTRSRFGHTGIADGTGGLYSAASYVRGVKHDETFTPKAKYLGYVTAFDFKEFY